MDLPRRQAGLTVTTRDLPPHLKPVRFSRLKLMGQSAAHYRGQFDEEREDSDTFRFGRLVHSLLLGGKFVVYEGRRAGKKWDEFELANAGSDIVTEREYSRGVRAAAMARKRLGELRDADPTLPDILVGEREKEIAWMCEGRACGARLDVLGAYFVTEVKTTASAEPAWFTRNGGRLGYHAQLAWYMAGARMAYPRAFERAFILSVEVKHPFEPTIFEVDQETLDLGARLWRSWFEKLRVCEASDHWPGYAQHVVPFHIHQDVEIDFGGES